MYFHTGHYGVKGLRVFALNLTSRMWLQKKQEKSLTSSLTYGLLTNDFDSWWN